MKKLHFTRFLALLLSVSAHILQADIFQSIDRLTTPTMVVSAVLGMASHAAKIYGPQTRFYRAGHGAVADYVKIGSLAVFLSSAALKASRLAIVNSSDETSREGRRINLDLLDETPSDNIAADNIAADPKMPSDPINQVTNFRDRQKQQLLQASQQVNASTSRTSTPGKTPSPSNTSARSDVINLQDSSLNDPLRMARLFNDSGLIDRITPFVQRDNQQDSDDESSDDEDVPLIQNQTSTHQQVQAEEKENERFMTANAAQVNAAPAQSSNRLVPVPQESVPNPAQAKAQGKRPANLEELQKINAVRAHQLALQNNDIQCCQETTVIQAIYGSEPTPSVKETQVHGYGLFDTEEKVQNFNRLDDFTASPGVRGCQANKPTFHSKKLKSRVKPDQLDREGTTSQESFSSQEDLQAVQGNSTPAKRPGSKKKSRPVQSVQSFCTGLNTPEAEEKVEQFNGVLAQAVPGGIIQSLDSRFAAVDQGQSQEFTTPQRQQVSDLIRSPSPGTPAACAVGNEQGIALVKKFTQEPGTIAASESVSQLQPLIELRASVFGQEFAQKAQTLQGAASNKKM